MKKHILLIASAGLLASCNTPNPSSSSSTGSLYELDLSVVSPVGAPAVALYRHLGSSNLQVVDGGSIAGFLSAESNRDIVIAPTNAGVKAIQVQQAPYKLAANLTFGNFYIAATGNDEDGQLDADDYVVAFQQNNIPGRIFNYVYGDLGLTNVSWKDQASDAKSCLISGIDTAHQNASVDYVFIAEPAMSHALTMNSKASEYANVQADFKAKTNTDMVQASIFVRNTADAAKVSAFLSSVKSDVEGFLANPSVIDSYVASFGEDFMKGKFSVPSTAFLKTITENNKNRMALGYKEAKENKDAINNFLAMFNMSVNEETYYI